MRDIGRIVGDRPVAGEQRFARLGGLAEARMIRTTSSRLATAMTRPSRMWARSRALASSNLVRRVITSSRKWTNALDDVAQVQQLGAAAADREHVGREAGLRRRVPPQLVEHHVGRRVALQVDDDAHALAVRFIANVADALDPLVLGGFGDLLDQADLADLIGDFGEHDRRRSPRTVSISWRERMMIEPRPV